jgi:hypothetical protein
MADLSTTLSSLGDSGKAYADQINKYAGELLDEAQKNYDFVVKYIKKEYETALGTDDKARQDFLLKVADSVEARIGRIPYDYEQKTAREKEDLTNYFEQSKLQRTDIGNRQTEFNAQQQYAQKQEKTALDQSMNARGMYGSGIQTAEQSKLNEKRQLYETDPFNRTTTLETNKLNLADKLAQLQSNRNLQDITTTARRDAADVTLGKEKGLEGADLDLWLKKRQIEREKSSALQQTLTSFGSNYLG